MKSKIISHDTPEGVKIKGAEYRTTPKVDRSKIKMVTISGKCVCDKLFVATLTRADIKAIHKAMRDTDPVRGRASLEGIKPNIKIIDPDKVKEILKAQQEEASK